MESVPELCRAGDYLYPLTWQVAARRLVTLSAFDDDSGPRDHPLVRLVEGFVDLPEGEPVGKDVVEGVLVLGSRQELQCPREDPGLVGGNPYDSAGESHDE